MIQIFGITGKDELEIPVTTIIGIGEILHEIQFSHRIIQNNDAEKSVENSAEPSKVSTFTQLVQHLKQVLFLFSFSFCRILKGLDLLLLDN